MWFRTLAESVVGIKGPVLRAFPGSVEWGVLILLSAVGNVVRIEEAQKFAMLYDTLWHIQGRSCRAQGRSCRGQGRSYRGQGRSCRQYRHAYIRHI